MPSFLHLPSQRVVDTDNHSQSVRYRRSHNFVELTESPAKAPDSYEDAPDTPATPPPGLDTAQVPEGNVSEVLAWAGDNPQRRLTALKAEQAGKNRVTLIRELED